MNQKSTSIQNIASNPDFNITLAASAGTGKTKVLTDRFIRLMLRGAPPEKILCLTFTNAAALEMKERIVGTLKEWQERPEAAEAALISLGENSPSNIARAKDLYDECIRVLAQLNITTIHGLCADIMRRFHGDDEVQIIQPHQHNLLMRQSVEEFLSKVMPPYSDYYDMLLDHFDIPQLEDYICQFLSHQWSMPLREEIYAKHCADSTMDLGRLLAWHKNEVYQQKWGDMVQFLSGETVGKNIASWLEPNVHLGDLDRMLGYIDIFLTQAKTLRKNLVRQAFAQGREEVMIVLRRAVDHAEKCWLCYRNMVAAEVHYALLSLSDAIGASIQQIKREAHWFSFSDLIEQTIQLLSTSPRAPGIMYSLDYQVDHILIDEAQDNSPKQWFLIQQLAGEFFAGVGARNINRTIFIVGDAKQSIYSFQGASPQLFIEMCQWFMKQAQDAQKQTHWLDMQVSFRSTEPILEMVNEIFEELPLSEQFLEVRHIAHRTGGGAVEVWPLVEVEKKLQKGWVLPSPGPNQTPNQMLAADIADRIKCWLDESRRLSGHGRTIRPGDIMILLRKRGQLLPALRQRLQLRDISVVECGKSLLRDHLICMDVIALLTFTLDTEDDLNLAALLRSPFFDVSEEDLFYYCYLRPHTLFERIAELAPDLHQKLQGLRDLRQKGGMSAFLLEVLYNQMHSCSFSKYFGREAEVVLPYILDVICDYEINPPSQLIDGEEQGLEGFLRWFAESNIELQISSEDADAVRLMTVHSAKGLQAPVVILADSASSENAPHQAVLHHMGLPFIAFNRQYDSDIISILKKENKLQQSWESNRLLYVALTRAEDEIYLTGCHNRGLDESWYNTVSRRK